MGFNFNSVNNFNQPVIKQPSKTSDGSGGNTGYFQQGKQDKEENERDQDEFDKSIFDGQDDDSFIQEKDTDIAKLIFNKIKKLFGKK